MSAITTTTTTASTPRVEARITTVATRLGKSFVTSDKVHVKRAEDVLNLRNLGLSYAGMEKRITVALGYRPGGATGSTFGRYGQVIDVLAVPAVDAVIGTGDAREAIVSALYRLTGPTPKSGTMAGTSPAERLTRAQAELAKAKGSGHAVEILAAMVADFNRGEVIDATTPPARPVAGEASNGGAAPVEAPAPAVQATAEDAQAAMAAHGTSALIAELTRRYSGSRATVHSADVEALAALASRVEALVTADRVSK
jgi:hypothetical protein